MDDRQRREQPKQLPLLDPQPNWFLDRRTREIGLKGVAEARAAVLRARRPEAA